MLAKLIRDQRGITGLETAIVLIAFVVVASVFAFAVLSTGLLSSEKSKETVLGGLEETSSTLSVRGDIIGDANSGKTALDTIKFTVTSAAQAAEPVDLSSTGAVVTYLDDN
jgi:flagellin FlaB